ncbi:MAG TPA: hypothetical protein VF360_05960, partial [Candidatus Methanoperedens sp.]
MYSSVGMEVYGRKDIFGKPLFITRLATADSLVSAAQGKADVSTLDVTIRDAPAVFIDGSADIPQMLFFFLV